MRLQPSKHIFSVSLYVKCTGIVLLLLSMVLIAACGDSNQATPGTPVATITVNFGQTGGSPTPPLLDHYCGGWATDTTPLYNPNGIEYVYGKFTQTISGNPVGVNNATAVATILWPDGSTQVENVTTSSDGIAVFVIPIKASAINHEVLIQITFTSGKVSCTVESAAYFTVIVVSPTPTKTAPPSPTSTSTPTVTPTGSPIGSPTPGGTGTPPAPTTTPIGFGTPPGH